MRTRIVKIGNSQGIRIPKPILEQTGLREEVEVRVERDHLVIGPVKSECDPRRANWAGAFKEMAWAGDDALIAGEGMPADSKRAS